MERIVRRSLCLGVFILGWLPTVAWTQQDWQVNAQIRHRYELDNRDLSGAAAASNFHFLRSRLGIMFKPEENLQGFLQLQDSRRLGEESNTLTDGSADNIDVHQAYFSLLRLFDLPMDVKLGRMEVAYGSQRLIGSVGWHNVGRSFDGAIFKFAGAAGNLDIFAFQEADRGAAGDLGDRTIYGAYGAFPVTDRIEVQPYVIWQRATPKNNLSRYTLGFYEKGTLAGLRHEAEFAYQGGKLNGTDVTAWMAAANVSRRFSKSSLAPELTFGVDILSGDDDPDDGLTNDAFNTLYATNHKFYGYMDYFINLPVHTGGLGLVDVYAKISIQANAKTQLHLTGHLFNAQVKLVDTNGNSQKKIGSEFDLIIQNRYSDFVTLVAGASVFTPQEIFKESRGEETATWLFLMTIVNL